MAAGRLDAHPLSASYSRFSVQGRQVEARLRLPLDDMDLLLRLDADLDAVDGGAPPLEDCLRFRAGARVRVRGDPPDLPRSGLVLSLFTFNLGVEMGQVVIVALMWPLLRLLDRSPHRLAAARLANAVIIACGLFWFLQRVS